MHQAKSKHIGYASVRSIVSSRRDPALEVDYVLTRIATVALYKAKDRGLTPGYESEDWRRAKAEVLTQIYGAASRVVRISK